MIDTNIFYESQLNNPKLTWELLAQPWITKGCRVQKVKPSIPILRGILPETEFGISGAHDFSSTQVPVIGGWIKTLGDAYNAVSETSSMLKGGLNSVVEKVKGAGGVVESVDNFISGIANKIGAGETYDNAKNLVGSRFITSFDKIAIFKGTNLEINFPPLEARIYSGTFHKSVGDSSVGEADSTNVTLKELEEELITRFIGAVKGLGSESSKLDSVVGAQLPPNGYVPSFDLINPDTYVEGAFSLRYGPYTIPNLLVSSFSYRVSTFKVRQNKSFPDSTGRLSEITLAENEEPLYMDVRIQVQPCTYITKELIINMMNMISSSKSE